MIEGRDSAPRVESRIIVGPWPANHVHPVCRVVDAGAGPDDPRLIVVTFSDKPQEARG